MEPQEMTELREAATPLLKLLNEKYHPHHTIIITSTSVKLLEDKIGIPKIYDYIKD